MTTGAKPRTPRASKPRTASKSASAASTATTRSKAAPKTAARTTAPATATRRKTSTKAVPPASKAPKTPAAPAAATKAKGAATMAKAPSAQPDRGRRRDLLNAIASRSDLPRDDLKDAMDLILEEMGKMLDAGEQVVLPPLGKLNVKKRVERGAATVLTVKLRRADEGRR